MIKNITSNTNPLIQRVIKLRSSKYRKRYNEFIAEGVRVITTLINAHHKPTTLFVTEKLLPQAKKLIRHTPIIVVSESLMKKISDMEAPSGILAVFPTPATQPYSALTPGVVLIGVQNPGNAGTLIRTAVAMNKKTAIFINSVDPWNEKVVQASAGAVGMINTFQLTWDELIAHKKNILLCALVIEQGKNPEKIDLHNSLIIVGNEGAGLSHEKIAQCDEKITLVMPGNFESLNASIAGSIALYLSTVK